MCLRAAPRVLWFVPRAREGPRRLRRTPQIWHGYIFKYNNSNILMNYLISYNSFNN